MHAKTILLLGSQGMLGTEIFEQSLEQENIEVIPLARFHIDFQNSETLGTTLETFLTERKIDAVVNTAAFTTVDKCEEPKFQEISSQVNAIAPGILAEICSAKDIPFYHFSTDYVFDGETDQKFSENDVVNPCNVYGKGKAAGEKNVLAFPNTKILRTAWLTGENGVNFVHKMVHLSKNVSEISVVSPEKGTPTFTKDVAKAVFELVQYPEKYPEKIYHFVSEGNASRRELLEEIQKFLGLSTSITDVKSDFFDLPAKRPYSSILVNNSFKKLPHWKDALHVFLEGEREKLEKKRAIEAKKERAKELYRKKQAEEREEKEKITAS